MQWDSKANINQIFRGAYFFYTIGLIKEAHRWAFESMVIQGYRPENIKLLIKTELISGHFKVAEKYINVLKKTFRFKGLAGKYEKMLYHPELIRSDPELGVKINLMPRENFLLRLKNQQDNILLLLKSNPGNKKAYEYMMAWYMLERNIQLVADELDKMKEMNYKVIPRYLEEAAVYFTLTSGRVPDLGGLAISEETKLRFSRFVSSVNRLQGVKTSGGTELNKLFGNTLWYYLEFR
jgi:hypothetical protein